MNIIGFLGIQRDQRGWDSKRWKEWRPSVAAAMQEGVEVDKYHLIYPSSEQSLMELIKADIEAVSPNTEVCPVLMDVEDEFEPLSVLNGLMKIVQSLPKDVEYLISLATGTHISHMVWFDIVRRNILNAQLMQLYALKGNERLEATPELIQRGHFRSLDLNMSKYSSYNNMLKEDTKAVEDYLKDGIITLNPDYNQLISTIEKVAVRNNMPILIDGKTGAGKTQLARRLYSLKKSKGVLSGDFKYINCAVLRPETAQSVLFGHKKGAFTGATDNRDGILKSAHDGVLFLDEIATLPLDVQGMLLNAIEEKTFTPMGSDSEVHSNFSLVCGTNVDLLEAVEEGDFREDLLARIDIWHFTLPSLSQRKEDIEPNIDVELAKYEKEFGERIRFSTEAKELYLSFAMEGVWSRNFRDLSASISRLATLCEGGLISESDATEECHRLNKSWGVVKASKTKQGSLISSLKVDTSLLNEIEKGGLEAVLQICATSGSAKAVAEKVYPTKCTNPTSKINNYLKRITGMNFKDIKALL